MTGKITYSRSGVKQWTLNGHECTEAEFEAAFPSRPLEEGECPSGPSLTGWPIHSLALKYHHSQREEATAHLAKLGVPTEIDVHGSPVLRNREHARRVYKALKVHDRNSFYGY